MDEQQLIEILATIEKMKPEIELLIQSLNGNYSNADIKKMYELQDLCLELKRFQPDIYSSLDIYSMKPAIAPFSAPPETLE